MVFMLPIILDVARVTWIGSGLVPSTSAVSLRRLCRMVIRATHLREWCPCLLCLGIAQLDLGNLWLLGDELWTQRNYLWLFNFYLVPANATCVGAEAGEQSE